MVNTTILENKIEALSRRLAALVAAVDAQKLAFNAGKKYRLTVDVMYTDDNLQKGDVIEPTAVTPKGDVFLYSQNSQEGVEVPLAIVDGWVKSGVLEEE